MTAAQKAQMDMQMKTSISKEKFSKAYEDEGTSADKQTNPTFVSVHHAEMHQESTGPIFMDSTYLKEHPGTEAQVEDFVKSRQLGRNSVHTDSRETQLDSERQQIFVWGSNSSGQLGLKNGNFGRFETPQRFSFHQKVQSISCGASHTAIVTYAKQLYMMGTNEYGQLGLGSPREIQRCTVPTLVQSLAPMQVLNVCCGARHTLAIGIDIIGQHRSNVYAWGDNSKGQLGVK